MRKRTATKFLSIAMMLVTPAAMLMAETGNTMLYTSGNVTLNGKEVTRSASVATGDRIETAGSTATAMSQDGTKVTVKPYSAIRYQSDAVNVVKGTAAVNTTEGLSAQVAQITVTPKDKTATYEVARLENNVLITSHAGALMVTEAGKTTEMEPGSSSSRAAEPTPAPAPQAAPVFPGSGLSTGQAWGIAAVVGGASIMCGLWCGMAAAGVEPPGTRSVNGAQARAFVGMGPVGRAIVAGGSVGRVIQVARVAATPVLNGIANNARVGVQARGVQPQQHRAVHSGR
jgi:hypothetical protein